MINIAILGTGKIIPEAIEAIQQSKKFKIYAIWSRPQSKFKAESLAQKFNIKKIFTDYAELLNDSEIDFVYVGLVNSVHYEYAKKALNQNKNVIMEKPFTIKSSQTEELINIAVEKNLFLFEAITTLHFPNFKKIRDTLNQIGEMKLIQCNFSQYSSRYDDYKAKIISPSFDPKFNGGALYDLNIYNINFVVGLFGKPISIKYFANVGYNDVDTSGLIVMKYENFIAHCTAAKDSSSPSYLIIQGDNGYIKVNDKPNSLANVEIKIRGREIETFNLNQFDHRMIHEFIEFAEIFETKNFDLMKKNLDTSKIVIEVAEIAKKYLGDVSE